MAAERWRLFVAVPIGDTLRGVLAASVASWRSRHDLAGLRWTDPDVWHVTLHFLGSTEPATVAALTATLAAVSARHEPMRLGTGGLGAFPSPGRARVAWYGIADPERRLHRLAGAIRRTVADDEAGHVRAHLTLARARDKPVDLRRWLRSASAPNSSLEVSALHLMRSHLGRGPVRYETIATLPLGAPVDA